MRNIEERYRTVVETIPDPYAEYDLAGNIVFPNQAFAIETGYSREELQGMNYRAFLDDRNADLAMQIFRNVLRTGEPIKNFELTWRNKDGEEKITELSVGLTRDADGNPIRYQSVYHNITQQRHMEAALRHAKEAAERANRAKDDLISNVSHELRTPMTTILEGVSQVLDGILGPTTEEQREFLGIVQASTKRLSCLIDDLLDLSKIEAGRLEIQKERVDMVSIVERVTKLFKPQADVKNIQIKTNFTESVIEAYIDQDKIVQVWDNLISNALKFTKRGHVELSVGKQEDLVICSVRDTGIGIQAEDISKIFSKFHQVRRNRGPEEKGTGLGLTIAKAIVELHGGTISVSSGPEQGSTFTFKLPRAPLR
jgi:PAS domain S-box-containing protein